MNTIGYVFLIIGVAAMYFLIIWGYGLSKESTKKLVRIVFSIIVWAAIILFILSLFGKY